MNLLLLVEICIKLHAPWGKHGCAPPLGTVDKVGGTVAQGACCHLDMMLHHCGYNNKNIIHSQQKYESLN